MSAVRVEGSVERKNFVGEKVVFWFTEAKSSPRRIWTSIFFELGISNFLKNEYSGRRFQNEISKPSAVVSFLL